MNKPIRNLAVACMLLFVALLVNATYVQYWQADDLTSLSKHPDNKRVRDAEFSRERGAILVRGKAVAESNKSDDEYKFQRGLPAARAVRPPHRLLLPRLRTRRRRVDPELDPVRQRLPAVRRQPGDRPGRQRVPQGRQRHPDRRPGRPAGGVRRAEGPRRQRARRRGRDRAAHRQDPRDGLQPELQPQPAGQPRLQRGRQGQAAPRGEPAQPAEQPGDRGGAAAGLDLQAGHRGGCARLRQVHPGHPGPGRREARPAADRAPTWSTTAAAPAAATRSRSPGRWRSPATSPSATSA